jgi:ABC-type nickel/cobalt efflux system permease component RcnA
MLAIILLLQSFAGISDAHQLHQAENQHQKIAEHNHDDNNHDDNNHNDNDLNSTGLTQGESDALDCHHCCHCHTPGHSALPVTLSQLESPNSSAVLLVYQARYLTHIPKSLYRPPIV